MNTDSLEIIVRRHQAEIYRYVRYLGADPIEAEDLVQETFLTAFKVSKYPELDDAAGTAAWLRAIARNMFLRHWQKDQKSKSREVVVDPSSLDELENVWSTKFLRGGDGFDYIEALQTCVGGVPEKQRQVLGWFYTDRKSRTEMAGLLGITEEGVKMMLRRIRAALADCIGQKLAKWETT